MRLRPSSDLALFARLLRQARPCWPHIGALLLLGLLSTPLALLRPVPLNLVVDCVLGTHPVPGPIAAWLPDSVLRSPASILVVAAVLLLLTALLSQAQALADGLLRTYAAERMVLEFRARLFRHVQRLPPAFHDERGYSDAAYRIQHDATSIRDIAIDGVIPLLTATVTLVSMLYVVLRIDAQLALVALAISPVLFFLSRLSRRSLRRRSRQVKRLESAALAVVSEVLAALRVVQAFGQEEREHGRYVQSARQTLRERMRLAAVEGGLGLLVGLTAAAGTAAFLFVGAQHVLAGTLTLGSLLLVMGYLAQLYEPLKTMSRKVASLQSHLASAERAFALCDAPVEVAEKPEARPIVRAAGAIAFRHVSFGYEAAQPILHDLCFEIPAGSRVGIVGTTGAGKTTLVTLLTRFYDPAEGQILLDGIDLRDYRLADLRRQFGFVLQDTVLFSCSIAENIAYARAEASRDEIVEAARAANAHDFIAGLPEGYETRVGERGLRLSGGERQRIALARAFLKDAPILVLDEPTSSVDPRTEAGILEAIQRLMRGRTTLLIAHRSSTLAGCDLLLRIEGGRLVERRAGQPGPDLSSAWPLPRAGRAGSGSDA